MSGMKRVIGEMMESVDRILELYCDAGGAAECELHPDILVDQDCAEAKEQAIAEFMDETQCARSQATETFNTAMTNVSWDCPYCAGNAAS